MNKNHVLVVDDDNSTRMLLTLLLAKKYKVSQARDGMEAMLWMGEGNIPDMILLDLDMPRLSGPEVLENIRKSGFYRDIPVVVISGSDYHGSIQPFLRAGIDRIFKKPFNPEVLLNHIETIINHINQKRNVHINTPTPV